jgi:hypothetical protein
MTSSPEFAGVTAALSAKIPSKEDADRAHADHLEKRNRQVNLRNDILFVR